MRAPTAADFAGTRRLTRLALRRDRFTLPAWWARARPVRGRDHGACSPTACAGTRTSSRETRLVASNAGMRLLGLSSGPSVGGYMLHREYLTLAVLAALMSTFAVVRHTRQNEELGRAELLGSTVVGRYAGLAAAVVVAVAANIVLAVAARRSRSPVAGSPRTARCSPAPSVAAVGLVFAGVAAVTVPAVLDRARRHRPRRRRPRRRLRAQRRRQHARHRRRGRHSGEQRLAGVALPDRLGAADAPVRRRPLVAAAAGRRRPRRAAGRWPSPSPPGGTSGAACGPSGAGTRAARRGRCSARSGWPGGCSGARCSAGPSACSVFGLIFGTLSEQIQDLEGAPRTGHRGGRHRPDRDAYRASIIQMAGMFVAIYVVQILLRLRVDEAGGTLEPVLASGVSRSRWVLSHVVNAVRVRSSCCCSRSAWGWRAGRCSAAPRNRSASWSCAALVQLPASWCSPQPWSPSSACCRAGRSALLGALARIASSLGRCSAPASTCRRGCRTSRPSPTPRRRRPPR